MATAMRTKWMPPAIRATTHNFVYGKAQLQDSKGKLNLKADVSLSPDYAGGVISVVAMDGDGLIFSGELAEGSLVVSTNGTSWSYKAAKGVTGITKAKVKALKDPGMFRVTMKTDQAWTAPAADETIVSTFVTLRVVDQCVDGAATKIKE